MTEKESQLNSSDNKKPNTQIPVIFQSIKTYENETEDSRFLKIKIWLMHTGKNFNGSSFTKEVVDAHLHTLANTPILAFIEENSDGEQDFSDHRMVLHRTTDGGIELKYLGSAVGVIPQDNNAKWETRVTDDGEELEYLTVEALMWTKWDEPINIMKEKGFTNQSMELADNYSGNWDKDGVFQFETFSFFGACLLGEGVMPAMKSSVAEVQFSKDENIQNTIESKMQEFYTLFSQEGGNEYMSKEQKEKVETESTIEQATDAQFAEATEMNLAFDASINSDNPENVSDDTNPSDDTNFETNPEDLESTQINSDSSTADTTTEFALTANQLREQLRIQIGKENHVDRWGDTCRSYWYVDHTDTTVIFENYQDGYQLYEATYTVNGDNVEVQTDKSYKVKIEYVPFEGESTAFTSNLERFNVLESQSIEAVSEAHTELNENFTTLTSDYEILKSQLTELQAYKRQTEESEIKAKFEGKLSDDEFTQVFTEMKENTLESIEEKLFALIGKKNFSIQSTQTSSNVNKVTIPHQKDDAIKSPYGDFFAD